MTSQYIAQTPSAYGFPQLIKGLLESGSHGGPGMEESTLGNIKTVGRATCARAAERRVIY
jgi:hypothetical protein